jgi:osmotically inducible protein OsmC
MVTTANMSTTATAAATNTSKPEGKVVYTGKAHTTGGRDGGASRTPHGRLEIEFSIPGGPDTGTNPEQLFAAGWSGCFTSAIKVVAARKKVRLPADLAIDAEVDLCTGSGGYFLQARLNVSLPGFERGVARTLQTPRIRRVQIPKPRGGTSTSPSI